MTFEKKEPRITRISLIRLVRDESRGKRSMQKVRWGKVTAEFAEDAESTDLCVLSALRG